MQKQIKSSYQIQKFNPRIQEIQKKYEGDQQRISEETQKIYAETGFNPLAGCLPMLLQMPIFIALFQVLQEMGTRVEDVSNYCFYNILPNLVSSPSAMWATGDALAFAPYILTLIFFAGLTFLPSLLMQIGQPDSQQKRQTIIMMVAMTAMMLFIGWGSPAGVLLFWATSSLFGVLQQQITMAVMRRKEATEEAATPAPPKPVEVDVTRRQHQARPTKSSSGNAGKKTSGSKKNKKKRR
jgi:YidC/Oxa1 family membrane protein insertase